jgi:hypothetical protein
LLVVSAAEAENAGCDLDLNCDEIRRLECRIRENTSQWRADAFTSYANIRDELDRLRAYPAQPSGAGAGQVEQDVPEDVRMRVTVNIRRALNEALLTMAPDRDAHEVLLAVHERRSSAGGTPQPGGGGIDRLLRDLWLSLRRPRFGGNSPPRRGLWLALKRFYSGADIAQSWAALHRARAALYTLVPACELPVQTRQIQGMLAALPDLASLLRSLSAYLNQKTAQPICELRAQLRDAYEEMIEASDRSQRDARALRNSLLAASLALFAVVLGIGLAHVFDQQIIGLCAKEHGHRVCPLSGAPHSFDVFAVALAGMLGGLLSVVIPLATGERIKTPYRVFNQQLLLKTLAGAASALAGVLLIESEVIALVPLKSSATVIGYAVVFGFSQQIVTGAVDRRANSLARQTPSVKDL